MNADRINALLASSYNLHIGPKEGGEAMTPAKAAKLPRGDRAALCRILEKNGGSDLYTAEDCRKAFAIVVG
jgi:hypothetical protein